MLMPAGGATAPAPAPGGAVTGAGAGGVLGSVISGLPAPPPPGAIQFGMPGSPGPGAPRTVATDTAGRFDFAALPAGSYRLRVMPGPYSSQYVGAMFGASSLIEQGTVIELADGQQFDQANVPLLRGGAITGRVMDDLGEPLTRVMVFASRRMPGTGRLMRAGGGLIQTDDHGRYRLYGLEPGEYVVTAEARGMGGPPVENAESEAFMTTFHPSATNESEAARVRVRAGADVDAVDIQLVRTRAFRITGTILDSQGRAVTRPNAMLARANPVGGFSSSGVQIDPQGRFTIRDVAPGDYTLVVRPQFGEQGSETAKTPPEYASVPVSVSGDIDDLVVVTQPGVTIAGQIAFVGGDPEPGQTIRVTAQPGSRLPMFGPAPTATVGDDRRFTLSNLAGPMLVRANLPRDWALKAVMLGGTEITDTPVEFRKEHSGHLQILVTTRGSALEGTVTGDDGKPVDQAMVLVFPEDRASWRIGSPHVRMAVADKDGRFLVTGLIGGRFHAAAFPFRSVALTPDLPADFFEGVARDATQVVLSDDERRVVDLRLIAARAP
jgi:protocatechuate 3,4-dioxygenase beta subunit